MTSPLVMPREERDAVERRRTADLERAERLEERQAWIVLAIVLAWFGLGAAMVAGSFHTRSTAADILFWGGLTVGNAGALYTWFFVYVWQK